MFFAFLLFETSPHHNARVPRVWPRQGGHRGRRLLTASVVSRYDLHLAPVRVIVKVRNQFAPDVHQTSVVVLLEQGHRECVRAERHRAVGPVGAPHLRQVGHVAGHQKWRVDNRTVDLHVQIHQGDVLL